MLAQGRGWQANTHRGLTEPQRKPEQPQMPGCGVVMLKHHAVLQYLWVREHLLQVENRPAGNVLLMKDIDPRRGGPQAQCGVEDVGERLTVRGAQVWRGKAAVGPQVSQL